MQISTITVLGLLSSGVTASIVPSTALPECAQLCLKDLHQKVGCAKADASCICSHTDAVLNQFAPCVNAKCTKTADVGGGLRHVLGLCESKQGNHRDFKRMLLALAKRDETDPEKETEQDTQEENETTVSGNGVSDPLTIEATKKVNETVPANAPLVVATDPAVNNPETLTTLPVNQTGTSTPTTTPDVLANTVSLTQTNTTIDAGAQPETPENPETSGNSLAGTSTLSADDVSKSAELTDDSEKAENTEDSQDVEEATDDPNKEEETYDETDSYGSYGAYNETSLAGARYHNKTNPYKSPKSSDKGDKGDNPGTKTSKGNSKDKDNGASTLSTGLFLMVASLIIAIA